MTRPFEPLPHAYPFRFVDGTLERSGRGSGRVRSALSAGGRLLGRPGASPLVLAEMVAQAALLLEGGDAELGRTGFLAGLSDFAVSRAPEAGDVLTVEVQIAGRLGATVKFEGRVVDASGAEVARGAVTVRQGTREAA